ncbi:hypothetical protein HYN59_16525 [Flavobacterium album]|uniref:VWA domain-containing protein n=1 Tax=Flavobacterium album TaxID=2175091 RepID=A0A2S1R1V0_9FLAO|nr:hypothetical protein [Flavobacterium album]AWH86615.1 hypothetical protein HYN59_16525 [Flavobacterium album]
MDIKEYFQSYDNYFWVWETEVFSPDNVFEALTIPGGSTIAYERFVMETLELLSPDGLPPFGSFLLALIATNHNGKDSLAKVFEIVNNSKSVTRETVYPRGFSYARNFLTTLSELPSEFREGDKRKELLQAIFKDCHNRVSERNAKTIMQHYREHKHLLVECAKKLPLSEATLKKDINVFAHLNVKYPTHQALLAAISGVPELPVLDEKIAEQQPVQVSGSFTDQLIDEPKTFPVGSLIHRIWGGLNIPLHHSAPSHQPLGGVSDLTNKGDFDKLLISEFAYDDDVFMSRIANNEALYIKREVPPESDKFVRLLLIDCSLKNWGIPKILAFASALAIAKHPRTDIECRIFVIGNGYKEISAETVEDVIDGLNNLGSQLHAAPALCAILDENTDVKHSEVFLITTEDALAAADMQRALSDNYDKVKYIITTEAGGSLNFYRVQNRSRKLIQHIWLPLEELWAKKPAGKKSPPSKHTTGRDSTVPEINYPILVPPPKSHLAVFALRDDEFFLLTNAGTFFRISVTLPENKGHYFKMHKGAELLLHDLSVNQNGLYALQVNEYGEYILAAFYPKAMYVSMLNLNTREYHKKGVSLIGGVSGYSIVEDDGFYLFNEAAEEYLLLSVRDTELDVRRALPPDGILQRFTDTKKKIERFNNIFTYKSVLQNFMPLCITKQGQLQINKHRLNINDPSVYHGSIILTGNRVFEVAVQAVYEWKSKRFVFPDGSAVYSDGFGILTLKSSNPDIPAIYMPTTLHVPLAMATDTCFVGSDDYYNDTKGTEYIAIDDFDAKYFQPFINTILNHGA